MSKPFKLHSAFSPSGDQPVAIARLKEGLEAGDRYEVLEQVMDDNGKTKYVRKGTIKVEKGQIWDNRFTEGDEKADPKQKIDRTFFDGGKDYYPGMLIRQIK